MAAKQHTFIDLFAGCGGLMNEPVSTLKGIGKETAEHLDAIMLWGLKPQRYVI